MFKHIHSAISQVNASLVEGVRALQGILARLEGLEGTIGQFELPEIPPPAPADDPRIAPLLARMDDLTTAVADGVLRVQRSENRIRAIVQGAKRELEAAGFDHAGVDAEARELRDIDGKTGDAEPVPTVPTLVENPADAPSSVPGVTMGQMRRVRG